jgi:hypothetical protein
MPARNESLQSTGRGYRGRKARTALTQAEINFCAHFVLTGNVKQASLIVKMLETGYKRTGDIQTAKVTNTSSTSQRC